MQQNFLDLIQTFQTRQWVERLSVVSSSSSQVQADLASLNTSHLQNAIRYRRNRSPVQAALTAAARVQFPSLAHRPRVVSLADSLSHSGGFGFVSLGSPRSKHPTCIARGLPSQSLPSWPFPIFPFPSSTLDALLVMN